jgi:hypothetical protein
MGILKLKKGWRVDSKVESADFARLRGDATFNFVCPVIISLAIPPVSPIRPQAAAHQGLST